MSVSHPTLNQADFPAQALPAIKTRASPVDAALRRALDVVVSAAALLLLLPLLALIALCIRLDSPGPILFVQKRVGRHGQEFPVFKFRSMFTVFGSPGACPCGGQAPARSDLRTQRHKPLWTARSFLCSISGLA